MKKALQFFALLAFTFSMTGCHDYTYFVDFCVENKTEIDIVVEESGNEITIKPGEEQVINEKRVMRVTSYFPEDYYEEEPFPVSSYRLKTNDKYVSSEIWARKHWDFTSEEYSVTYTLIITGELIESVGFEE